MKKMYYLSILAIVVSMLIACQEEISDATQPSKSTTHSSLRDGNDDCQNCVENYADSKVIFNLANGVIVEAWNDATTVYYKLYRSDNAQIGNLFLDNSPQGGGKSNLYNFTKPIVTLAACQEQTTHLKVVGLAGGGNVETDLVYKIVTLCTPPPVCISYTYDTGIGGPMINKGGGKAWWYYYTAGSGPQTIWAGQTKDAGTVVIDGDGFFTITLKDGWELKSGVSEPVKIQGYIAGKAGDPGAIPLSRPSAGLFTGIASYKGSSLSYFVSPVTENGTPIANYVVHLDLQKCSSYGE